MPRFANNFMSGGSNLVPGTGFPWLGDILEKATGVTLAQAKATDERNLTDQQIMWIAGVPWKWDAASVLDGDDILIAELDDAPDAGRLLRLPGYCKLSFNFTYAKADAAVHYTMPTGAYFMPIDFYWEITTGFTGGSSSAIGVSTTKSGMTTKGDLLGGAAGDVAATLVAGTHILGTIGPKWDAVTERRQIWAPTEVFRHDRITSAFEVGVGIVHVPGILLANAGA